MRLNPQKAALWTLTLILFLWNYFLIYMMIDYYNFNDFGKLYYSARDFLNSSPMYAENPATYIKVTENLSRHFWNLNPPHLHLIVLPLALLPLPWALAAWGALSLFCLALCLKIVAGQTHYDFAAKADWLIPCGLAFVGTQTVSVTGQLTFILLVPLTLFWRAARQDSWKTAGAWLGLAFSVKPFLLIFGPYLLIRRKYSAIISAAAVAGASFGLGLAVFGLENHRDWLAALGLVDWPWAGMNASLMGYISRCLEPSPYFKPLLDAPWLIKPLWAASCLALYGLTLRATWPKPGQNTDRDLAVTLFAALLISPLGWTYYLWLPLGPASAWAVSKLGTRGFKTGQRKLILFALGLLMLPLPAAMPLAHTVIGTLSLGSAYFFGTLICWYALTKDALAPGATS